MPATPPALDNRPMADLALLERIRALADTPANGASPGALAEIEHTLTDGYARALALDAERSRIEKRIGELARNADDPDHARELRRLALERGAAEEDLTHLRTLLGALHERAETIRSSLQSR